VLLRLSFLLLADFAFCMLESLKRLINYKRF
jgi:hypothetical protein